MAPRFVRIVPAMPVTATNKVHRVALRREGFRSAGPVWWNGAGGPYERLRGAVLAALLGEYEAHGRTHLVSSGDGGQHD
jgi:fatty-acyl-CoA synthase